MPVIRTLSRFPFWVGTVMTAPGSARRAFAVSSVTAPSTSEVFSETSPRTAGHFPARRVAWSGRAERVE